MLKLFENKKFLFLLMLINFFAGLYSIGYYLPQLARTDFWLWLFVIDCPFYSILFGIILFLKFKEKKFSLLGLIAIVGCIKYALWTLFILFIMNNIFVFYLLTIGHVLLLIQVIVFYKFFEFKVKHVLLALLWFFLNDFFDYIFLTHPFFDKLFFVEVASFSFLLSLFIVLFVSIFFLKK
jgi:uncharacterized membrane protein YpjA